MSTLVMFGLFIVLCVIGVNIAVSLGMSTLITVLIYNDFPLLTLAQRFLVGVNSYTLLAVPLFILSASIMNSGGISSRLFDFARACIGHVRGSLAYVNVLGSMLFAGMSGSAVSDAGGLGMMEVNAMVKEGYPKDFACALTITSSAIGPIIPPSIPFLMYAAIAEVSSGDLFIAGVVPGVLMGIFLMIYVFTVAKKKNFPVSEKQNFRARLTALRKGTLPMLTPLIILGGIMGGIFTPTEAGSIAVVYALILSLFVYREITIKDLPKILIDALVTTTVVTFMMAASSGFSLVMLYNRAPQALTSFIASIVNNKFLLLLILNIVMLVLGSLMEAGVLITLLTPLFIPMAKSMGIDLVQFGVIMVLNLMIGVATPPVGMSLFVVSHAADIRIEDLGRTIWPQFGMLILVLMLVTYIPGVSLWLGSLFS